MKREDLKNILILLGVSYLFFMIGNGSLALTNPDEVFYTQTAKEMVERQSWLTPYMFGQPQFEKPIFIYILLRLSYLVFGISSFSSRFFPAVFGGIGVLAIYWLASLGFKDRKKAFFSALILASSGLYIGLARTVFTDLVFSIFILLSLVSFFWAYSYREREGPGVMLFFIFSGLAVLTKGPLGILIPFLAVLVYLFFEKKLKFLSSRYFFWGALAFVLIAVPWYALMIREYGRTFTHEFFYNDHIRRILEAEHASNDTWYFYPFSMLGCMFPWSVFALAGFIYLARRARSGLNSFEIFLVSWIAVVFVIFQSAHSKLVSYIFPLFPALAVIAAHFMQEQASEPGRKRIFLLLLFLTLVFLIVFPAFLIVALKKFPEYFPDKRPIFAFMPVYLFYIASGLFLFFKGRFIKVVYLIALSIPLLLAFFAFVEKGVEPYMSSRAVCDFLLKNYRVNNVIICSKPFVRGVRFYSNKEVAVVDPYGSNFFSPHPLTFLDTDEKIRDFLKNQSVTYGVLKRSVIGDLERAVGKPAIEVLKVIGNEYIVRIDLRQAR